MGEKKIGLIILPFENLANFMFHSCEAPLHLKLIRYLVKSNNILRLFEGRKTKIIFVIRFGYWLAAADNIYGIATNVEISNIKFCHFNKSNYD